MFHRRIWCFTLKTSLSSFMLACRFVHSTDVLRLYSSSGSVFSFIRLLWVQKHLVSVWKRSCLVFGHLDLLRWVTADSSSSSSTSWCGGQVMNMFQGATDTWTVHSILPTHSKLYIFDFGLLVGENRYTWRFSVILINMTEPVMKQELQLHLKLDWDQQQLQHLLESVCWYCTCLCLLWVTD